jgi:hypothetical protein
VDCAGDGALMMTCATFLRTALTANAPRRRGDQGADRPAVARRMPLSALCARRDADGPRMVGGREVSCWQCVPAAQQDRALVS